MSTANVEWPMEKVAQQFRDDVQKRFERENAEWLTGEREGIAKIKADCDAKGEAYPAWLTPERNSFYWEIYSASVIAIESNSVDILLPQHFAVYPDFIEMFSHTAVGWSIPSVDARIVDGEARLFIHLILIDYWDDERHAKWLAEHPE